MEMISRAEHAVASTEELVVRSRRRDALAFADLIRRYERVALSVAYAVTGDADAAGDVTQDAFLRAWQRLDDLREPSRFATWLCGITRNLAIDARRRDKHFRRAADLDQGDVLNRSDERGDVNPLDTLDRREQNAQVAAALASLDDITRPAVILRYYDGLSSKEIGEALGMSPAAVDMRLSRARQHLKNVLTDMKPAKTESLT